jgi:hypothetical protein
MNTHRKILLGALVLTAAAAVYWSDESDHQAEMVAEMPESGESSNLVAEVPNTPSGTSWYVESVDGGSAEVREPVAQESPDAPVPIGVDDLNPAANSPITAWRVLTQASREAVPCAEISVRTLEGIQLFKADATGVFEATLEPEYSIALRLPGQEADPSSVVPCRLAPGEPGGPALIVELASIIIVAAEGDGPNGIESDWTLIPTGLRVNSYGRQMEVLEPWTCMPGLLVFPVSGRADEVDVLLHPRATFVVRGASHGAVGMLDVPWPCWPSDGVHQVVLAPPEMASLRITLASTQGLDSSDAVVVQVTLKASNRPNSSKPIAMKLSTVGDVVNFDDLQPTELKIFISGTDVVMHAEKVVLHPGLNEVEIFVDLATAPQVLEVLVTSPTGKLPDPCLVVAFPEVPGPSIVEESLVVESSAAGVGRARAVLPLTPGNWSLRVYSPRTGHVYLDDHRVRAEDVSVSLVLPDLGRMASIRLAPDATASEFWIDVTGEGLLRRATDARSGALLAEVHEQVAEIFWVLIDAQGQLKAGDVEALERTYDSNGDPVYTVKDVPQQGAMRVFRIAREGRGIQGSIDGNVTDRWGYVVLNDDHSLPKVVRVGGRLRSVVAHSSKAWLTTLWVEE